MRETDRGQFAAAVFVAGNAAVGGVGAMGRRRDTAQCQQTTKPRIPHVCCLLEEDGSWNWVKTGKAKRWSAEMAAHLRTFIKIGHKLPAG
jgi:hypothetical protein